MQANFSGIELRLLLETFPILCVTQNFHYFSIPALDHLQCNSELPSPMAPWKPCHQAEIQQQEEKIRKNGEGTKKNFPPSAAIFSYELLCGSPRKQKFRGKLWFQK